MAAAPTTCSDFKSLIVKSGLIDEAKMESLEDLPDEPSQCAAALIEQGILTKFQAKLLLNGRYKGFKLGSYFIRDQIGQGGMGAVYLAEHETLRRKVALKVLTLPKEGNAALSVERFLREARSAAALDHPNIVRLHDIGKQGDTHFLVMEYVEGQTLDQIVSRAGPISSSRAVDYISQAAAGLQHASEKGFIHRDIKPANLMLTRDGQIKILDMGLARPADEKQEQLTEQMDKGAIVGTADFISPEQAMNGKLDVRSDIYSLGATFFALVTGQPPFSGNTTQKLIQHQMKDAPTVAAIDKTFPPGLSEVVAKMLAKKPEHRYQTPAEVITALTEWLPQQASARMIAAISATDLAQSSEMQATLSEIAGGGTKRIGTQTRLNAAKAGSGRWFWPGLAAGVLMLAGGTTAALSFGKKEDTTTEVEQRDVPVVHNSQTSAKTKAAVVPPKPKASPQPVAQPKEPIAVAADPTQPLLLTLEIGNAIYSERGSSKPKTVGVPSSKTWQASTQSGMGKLPEGWIPYTHMNEAIAEVALQNVDGRPAMGLRKIEGSGLINISSPLFETVTGKITVAFQYKTKGTQQLQMKFVQSWPANKPAYELASTEAGKSGSWHTFRQEFDLRGGTKGRLEFTPRGNFSEFLWIRDFTVHQAGAPTDRPDRNATLYAIGFEECKPCSAQFEKMEKNLSLREINKVPLPHGFHINQHRSNVASAYEIKDLDGVRCFGMQITDGDVGVQVHSNLGDAITKAKPGEAIRVRVTYRHDGRHSGTAAIQQLKMPYTKFQSVDLTPTNGQWKTITIVFVRPAESESYELILNCGSNLSNRSRVEGMICVSKIEAHYADAK